MTAPELIVMAILAVAFALSMTNRVRMDLVALVVIVSLAAFGILTPVQALSGFGNPATVTIWAMFILSGGLYRAGVAGIIARHLIRFSGRSEMRLIATIMMTAATASAFMNNVAVIALFLPVVMDLARETARPPARLLLPLTSATLLGGTMTLVGTAPNLLASDALRNRGLEPFRMFDFFSVGLVLVICGTIYMLLFGRRLLPKGDSSRPREADYSDFELDERVFVTTLPWKSLLAGKTVAESRIGTLLGMNLLAVLRSGHTRLAPEADYVLRGGDKLVVSGRMDSLQDLRGWSVARAFETSTDAEAIASNAIQLTEMTVSDDSDLIGLSVADADLRGRWGVNVVAVYRGKERWRSNIQWLALESGDRVLLQGAPEKIAALSEHDMLDSFEQIDRSELTRRYALDDSLFVITVSGESTLQGKSLAESRLGAAFGLNVLSIERRGERVVLPSSSEKIEVGDRLIVEGRRSELDLLDALRDLELTTEGAPEISTLQSPHVGLQEFILSPHSSLVGKTLRDIHFRDKYHLTVLAILRGDKVIRSRLSAVPLQTGDALLVYGPRKNLMVLGSESDFLALTKAVQEPPRSEKTFTAAALMVLTIIPVIAGMVHVSIAAVGGAALMVITGCLRMEEAYRFIDWKSVFLIAGMLPLGIALEQTGAALTFSEFLTASTEQFGARSLIFFLFLLAVAMTQVVPPPATVVLLAPVAINSSIAMSIEPHAAMLALSIAAASVWMTPTNQPINLLIMGPGGYHMKDFLKVGIPLTIITLLVLMFVLPLFWPLV